MLGCSLARLALFAFGACLALIAGPSCHAQACSADSNGDLIVNVGDLLAVIASWGDSVQTHTVIATNFEFQPQILQARAGDTIEWTLALGFHTVTSGSLCNGDGLFNAALTPITPSFSYTLTAANVGTLEYFCDPHCGPGMSGTIDVAPFPADVNADGAVNVNALLAVIKQWGPCR